ncbi:MAG: AAA family ATPase, partial [Desulfuromonadales bacterium]|nr:AAA family ATPase [Desulfuromonadales bacterium]
MYSDYFDLQEPPFSIAPDPRYLYLGERHREALAHLLYGIGDTGGFVLLTGEVGTGKTTVCRCLLEQLPAQTQIAYIINPRLSALELLATICDELGIVYPQEGLGNKLLIDRLNAFLLDSHAQGRQTVLIIDEAQNLSPEVLEQVRLLTNLETSRRKLLQIVMLGQPELRRLLARPELRQLAQRITARYHLEPLSRQEIAAYLSHRLAVAGGRRLLFPPRLIGQIYGRTGGIPRRINILCDRALLGAYVRGEERVTGRILGEAARELALEGGG